MDVLLDIIKFLKKLQSGQHDIEAGQFELYEGMENVSKTLEELKALKKDVDDMKASNIEQIEIIQDLQLKLGKLRKKYKSINGARSCSATYYSEGFGDVVPKKGFKKIHRRIEEIVDITSDISNDKWISETSENNENDQDQSTWTENEDIYSEEKTTEVFHVTPQKTKGNHRCKNSEMLQRYLQDSAKYRERRMSKGSVTSSSANDKTSQTGPSDIQCGSYWKGNNWEDTNGDKTMIKEMSAPEKSVAPKSFCCPFCFKKFTKGIDYSMHKKKHFVIHCRICRKDFTNKEQLKQHYKVHNKKPRNFEGFTCCYCHLVCSTPEKLTAHLRRCRIITRTTPKTTL